MINNSLKVPILNAVGLCAVVSGTKLFENISFSIHSGECVLIVGMNGHGKTTLLKAIVGLVVLESGEFLWHESLASSPSDFFCYVGHEYACDDDLTVYENLEFWAKFYGFEELIDAAIAFFKLQDFSNICFKNLSAGTKRKVSLARLLVKNSPIWILDEPYVNLDDTSRKSIKSLIEVRLQNGGIVIMTSHRADDLEKVDVVISLD